MTVNALPLSTFLDSRWHKANFGEIVYKPGATFGPRRQEGLQLVYVFSGSLDLHQDKNDIHLEAGQALMLRLNTDEYFQFSKDESTHHGWCEFRPIPTEAMDVAKKMGDSRSIIHFSDRMLQLHKEGMMCQQQGHIATAAHLVAAVMTEYQRLAENPNNQNYWPKSIQRAKTFLESHLDQSISMAEVAKFSHISLPHLNRLFKQYFQLTPSAYFSKLKMTSAANLLSESGLELEEIAERFGFSNLSHFCQYFKRYHRISPLQFRKKAWSSSRESVSK